MRVFRFLPAVLIASAALFQTGCGGAADEPVEVVEKPSWVGKRVIAKRTKTKQHLLSLDGKAKPAGDWSDVLGTVKAENTVSDQEYLLIRSGLSDTWLQKDDVVLLDEAIEHFTKVLDSASKSYDPRLLRAMAYLELGKPEKALYDASEAFKSKPNGWEALRLRGQANEAMGDYRAAFKDYDQFLKTKTDNLEAFLSRARVQHAMGDTDNALIDLARVIEIDQNSASCLLLRASIWTGRNEHLAAEADLDQAARIAPRDPVVFSARGQYWLKRKNFAKAATEFDTALKHDGEYVAALIGKAQVLAFASDTDLRNPTRAVDVATKACELSGWRNAEAIDVLGSAYAANGNFSEAVRFVKQALDDIRFAKRHGEAAKKRLALFQNNLPPVGLE